MKWKYQDNRHAMSGNVAGMGSAVRKLANTYTSTKWKGTRYAEVQESDVALQQPLNMF